MNQEIKEVLLKHNIANGYGINDEDLLETLFEADNIYEKLRSRSRWWEEYFYVVEIDGVKIGFNYAISTGDNTATDLGWEFDPNSICFVEEYSIVAYRPKK